eukprot:15333437-Ditylum_brightwellii.AAC.2
MDGDIISDSGAVNFEAKEVNKLAIELMSKEMLSFGRGTEVDKVIDIQANIDGWHCGIKVTTK